MKQCHLKTTDSPRCQRLAPEKSCGGSTPRQIFFVAFSFLFLGETPAEPPPVAVRGQVDTITQVNKGRSLQPWHLPSNLSLPTMAQQGTGTADILLLHGLTTKTRGPSTRAKRVLCVQLLHLAGKPTHLSCAWRIPSLLFSSLPSSCLLSILSSPFPTSQQIAGLSFVCNCCRSVSKQLPPPLQAVTYPNHIRLPGISLKRPPNNETRFVIIFFRSHHSINRAFQLQTGLVQS